MKNYTLILGESPSKGARSPILWNKTYEHLNIDQKMYPKDIIPDDFDNEIVKIFKDKFYLGGAVAVPLNSWWQGDELEYGLNNSDSKLFIADQERLERLGNKCPDIKRISVRSENPDHSDIDFYTVIENQNKTLDNEVAVSPDDDASIMYTSGSTGHPKGVVSSHRSVMFAPFYWIALQTLLKESSDEENLGIMDINKVLKP